ncbi:MAG: hypothetical protein RIQ81_2561 [Pseudomonadota bacterium]|jgi:carbon monoxide dehydrogenase subunit G
MTQSNRAVARLTRLFAAGLTVFQIASSSLAQPPGSTEVDDPVDRRLIDFDTVSEASDGYLAAKKAEAGAMVRWFEARLRLARIDAAKHVVEHRYNQEIYTRLQGVSGAISGARLLEARKQTELDDFIAQQLAVAVEMAEADLAAARARFDSLNFVRGP